MKRYGLMLSCEEYKEYDDICYCHSDALLLQETLVNYCDYGYSNLELIPAYIDDDTTPEQIYKKLSLLIDNADSDDIVMFYFAGHGMKIESEGFLILPNTKKSDIAKTAIELKKLNEIMLNKKCNCFIILDACHSGLSPRGEQISLFVETLSDKSCVTLASCSENECSYPDENLEQGVFTYYLAEAIKGSPLEQTILLDKLKVQICENLEEWCSQNYKKQTPTLVGTIVGNTSIATRNSKPYEYAIISYEKKEVTTVENTHLEITPSNNSDIVSPALWQSNSGIELPKVATLDVILNYNYQLKTRELSAISQNYNAGFFEMASESIWNRSIAILRNRVLALGLQFVSEMVGIDNLDYIQNLPAFEVINLAMELGFINATGKMRLTHANEIVQHYLERDVMEEMPQNESDSVIRPCIQYILGYEDSNIQIEYTDFRTSLKVEDFSGNPTKLESLNASPYFYKKTTIRTLVNLLSSTEGAEFETVESNFILIIKTIWKDLTSDDKYFLGLTFSKHKNDGNTKLISAFTKALMSVRGFDYVPENLRSLTFIEAAKNLKSIHYAMNNFYNEPSAVKELNRMGTKIPKPAIKECISATLMVLLGNAYGRSFEAIEPAEDILQKLSQSDWIYYIEQCLPNDEEVLQKISSGGARVERWCNIVKEFDLKSFEYQNSKIQEFIKFSANLDKNNAKSCANSFYKKLINLN